MKVKYKISVSSDAEETLKYPYVQIKIEIRNRNMTTILLIKGTHQIQPHLLLDNVQIFIGKPFQDFRTILEGYSLFGRIQQ